MLVPLGSCADTTAHADAGPPEIWSLGSEPKVTIGDVESEPPYVFSEVVAAAMLPDGRVAVGDRDAATIRVFAVDGTIQVELGRRGEGPGEFAAITAMSVAPPDTLLIHDGRLLRVTRFLASGPLIGTLDLQAEDGFPEVYLGRFSNGEYGFGWIRQGPRDPSSVTPDVVRLARFDTSGRMRVLLGSMAGMLRTTASPTAFSPHPFARIIRDSVFLTNGLPPEIRVWDQDGELSRTFPVPAPALSAPEAWAELEEVLASRGDRFELQWLEDQPREGEIPPVSRVLVDGEDRLWLKRYDPRTDSHLLRTGRGRGGTWIVMDLEGAPLAEVTLPDGLLLLDVRADRLVGQTRDGLGVERVEVFELTR